MTRFKAIFFDAAGTLLHAHPSVGHVYAEVIGRHGPTVEPQAMEQAFRKTFAARRNPAQHSALSTQHSLMNEDYEWWKQLVFEVMADLRIKVASPDALFHELYWRFAEVDAWRLFPDALPALIEARGEGLKIAIISNWDVRLRRLLEGMGVISLFDAVLISTEVGVEKPDPRIFQFACEQLGVQPGEALHVGDNLREDVEGARAAGVAAILIDRKGGDDPGSGIITDLRQIDAVITRRQIRF
jgi:putative hydrolase of the HAD superfamily